MLFLQSRPAGKTPAVLGVSAMSMPSRKSEISPRIDEKQGLTGHKFAGW